MLNGSLYQVKVLSHAEETISATITLSPAHKIFNGHYPGQPVLPGACMLQILKEILETALSAKLLMNLARQIKFLAIVDPLDDKELKIEITYHISNNELDVRASSFFGERLNFKFQGKFRYNVPF